MTESPFPFGSEEPTAYAEEAEEASSRRPLVLAVAGLAVVALAGGYLLLGGSGAVDEEFVPAAAPRAGAPVAPAEPAVPAAPQTVPVAFDGVTGRNPFKALYVAPAGGGGGGASAGSPTSTVILGSPTTLVGGTGTTSGTTTTTTKPTTSTTTTTTTKPAPTGTTAPAPAPAKPVQTAPKSVWIEMPAIEQMTEEELKKHLADGTWRFTVAPTAGSADVEEHTVKPGDTFAEYFKLVRLVYRDGVGQCAELRFGEQPFSLCGKDSIQF